MKKILVAILGLAMVLGIAGCAKKVEVPSKKDVKNAVEEEYDMDFKLDSQEIAKDEKSAEWVFISKDGSLEVTVTWNAKKPDDFEFEEEEHPEATETEPIIETETETETETTPTTTEDTQTPDTSKAPAVFNGDIINFDEMNFYINGTKFTLGKTTLQDMIDAGVPFDKEDLENAGNNLKSNYQSDGFTLSLGGYNYARIYFLNYSEEGKPLSECVANEITFSICDQDILSFDFPLNMTAEELVATAGEPNNEVYHYESETSDYVSDKYKYSTESTKYYGGSYYEFTFVNGEFDRVWLSWMP